MKKISTNINIRISHGNSGKDVEASLARFVRVERVKVVVVGWFSMVKGATDIARGGSQAKVDKPRITSVEKKQHWIHMEFELSSAMLSRALQMLMFQLHCYLCYLQNQVQAT